MCGIAGAAGGEALESRVAAMLERLAHRGPGERRIVARAGVALGMGRLHVVAPSAPTGPYVAAGGAVAAVVNGEIWNHEDLRRDLASRGIAVPDGPDTAVVAPLYAAEGVAGLSRLRGMFAIALHDGRDGSLVLARDRFGIKPLHYALELGEPGAPIEFASEAGALGTSLEVDGLADYLALGAIPSPGTFDAAVEQVEPGFAMVRRGTRTEFHAIAALPEVDPDATVDVAALRAVLERAVRRHLMGDVPVGVLLSGGVDSSIVAALVQRAGVPARLFSMTFPGERGFDEGPAARAAAAHLGMPLVESTLSPADVPGLLAAIVSAHGGPFADASALATHALCRRASEDVRVVLSGSGADELFVGYRRYRLGRLSPGARAVARAAAAVLPTSRRTRLGTLGALARKAARAQGEDAAAQYLETLAVVPAAWRTRLLGRDAAPPVLWRIRDAFEGEDEFADGARRADLAVYLPDDLLPKEDRAASAVSMENRVPYLDDEVADLAGSAPASAHLRAVAAGGRVVRGAKASLRAAAGDLLPGSVLDRPKQGFGVPISEWMRSPLASFVDSHLADPRARLRDHVDPQAVADLVAAHRRGDDDLGPAVWALVVLEAALRTGRRSP